MGRSIDYVSATNTSGQLSVLNLIYSDLNELKIDAMTLFHDVHSHHRHDHSGFGAHFLRWLASSAAIYLLILDRTNWRTNMLTSLLVPYIFLSLPYGPFHLLRGEFGKWIAFVAVVLRLFFHRRFPEWLEMPGSLILLLVVAPDLLAHKVKGNWVGIAVLLFISCYLFQEHIRASGGFRNSFTQTHGVSNSIGLLFLLAYPIWSMVILMMIKH